MEGFNFTTLYKMLKSDNHYNKSHNIEILKGRFEKISDWKDVYNKGIRKIKFKR